MSDDEDDIVERLRSPEVLFTDGQMISPVACVAATEIERLREVLRLTHNVLELACLYRGYEGGPLAEPFTEHVRSLARAALGEDK